MNKKILYFAITSVILLIVLELLLRLIFRQYAVDENYYDRIFFKVANSVIIIDSNNKNFHPEFGFLYTPNSQHKYITKEYKYNHKTNSLGFYTKEIKPKKKNEYRILLVGDSMFEGVGVENKKRICSLLEKIFRFDDGNFRNKELIVYNYSVSGYNTVQQLIVARKYYEKIDPDQIILGFFIANDIITNSYSFVDSIGNLAVSEKLKRKMKQEIFGNKIISFPSVITRILADRIYAPKLRYKISVQNKVIDKSLELIKEFHDHSKLNDYLFSLVLIYPRDAVQGGLVERWSNSRHVGSIIRSYCIKNEISFLDLIDKMNTKKCKKKYFFKKDGHFNEEGNLIIAKSVYDKLVRNNLKESYKP